MAVETTELTYGAAERHEVLDCYKVTADKLVRLVERIVAKAHPVRIIAFGSRARGHQRPNSDIDLAVIVREYDYRRDLPPVDHGDLQAGMMTDLLVIDEARQNCMKDSIISVEHEIDRDGVTLYDESSGSIDHAAIARVAR